MKHGKRLILDALRGGTGNETKVPAPGLQNHATVGSNKHTEVYATGASSSCRDVEGDDATLWGMKRTTLAQRASATDKISCAGYPFPPDVISYA